MSTAEQPPIDESLSAELNLALEQTFLTMFGERITSTFKVVPVGTPPKGEVSALVNLSQKEPQGAIVFTYPQATIFTLLKKFYRKEFTEVDQTVMNAAGEIANIVFGAFKHKAGLRNYAFRKSLPTLSTGSYHRIPGVVWSLHGEIKTESGPFHVLVVQVRY